MEFGWSCSCRDAVPAAEAFCHYTAPSRLDERRLVANPLLEPGSVLDSRYRIDALVGQGGMARVYRATDLTLRRSVAVKVAHASATGASTLTLFLNEAQALARVEHPGLVPVYAVGRAGELYYLAMKFIEGRTLADVLKTQKTLPPTKVAQILIAVCGALSALHHHGLVHRDVKPGNIMVGDDGKVTVMDLGIVQSANSSDTASTLGTPRYMAPEMLSNTEIDGRADIYGLGVIGYHALTGSVPFDGPTPMAILSMHAHEPVEPLRNRAPQVPKALAAAIELALAKSPNARYPTAEAFAATIREAMRPSRMWIWAVVALLVLAGIGTAVLLPSNTIAGPDVGLVPIRALNDGRPVPYVPPSQGSGDSAQPATRPGSVRSASPDTAAPRTAAPETQADAPVTAAPVTAAPVTAAPVTAAPVTAAPVTAAPVIVIVRILSSPLGATVKRGRVTLGKTPLVLERPAGTRGFSVQIAKPGYDPVSRSVSFKADRTLRATLKSGFELVP
ncbi:MAG: serine/threonine protein kinase [Bradymonadia bacterium]|jgi:serine/threonine protein kinase